MKDKSMKSMKSKAKKDAKTQVEKEVELTPKQLKEKRREEARARAAETRKIVTAGIGQWTGKLPAQLLNEYAQKNKWERVEYPCKNKGSEADPKWHCFVILGKRNAKTKEIERVRFEPPLDLVTHQPTQVEARNYAATYAMHRVLSHQNMKMMLPPPHRDVWMDMEKMKNEAKAHEKYQWSEDPWQAAADRKASYQKHLEEKEEKRVQREHDSIVKETRQEMERSEEAKNADKAQHSHKKIKFNHTLVMPRNQRAIVEATIRNNHGFKFSSKDGLEKNSDRYKHILKVLTSLGFNSHFAEESLEYSSTIGSALIWLLVHVPEDDIPKSFMPSHIGTTARISSNIKVENTLSKLQNFGYSEDVALGISKLVDGDLRLAVATLTDAFIGSPSQNSLKPDDSVATWQEEMESIKCVLENGVSFPDPDTCVFIEKKLGIKVICYRSNNYPDAIPGIAIEPLPSSKVSKFVLLSASNKYANYSYQHLRGDYMVMSLLEYIKETFHQVLKSPGKLSQVAIAVSGVNEDTSTVSSKSVGNKKPRNLAKINAKDAIAKREKRMATPEGQQMLSQRQQLPAWEKNNEIVSLVSDNRIVLVTGETGSGKSTQVVQFILDSNPTAQVVCTQPRRISAIGVAQRVAQERNVDIGGEVGYVIKGEAKVGAETQLRFVTSGVLLRILQSTTDLDDSGVNLQGITHIVVDEVHERSLDGDFLLILLKRLIQKNQHLKIILMSATVDPKQFTNYFKPLNVGYTHIKGRTFPVKQFYIDDVIKMSNYRPPMEEHTDDIGKILGAIKENSNARVDYNLAAAAVHSIHERLAKSGDNEGSILVFMSGAGEIDRTINAIDSFKRAKLYLVPLHASLSPNDQRKVFKSAPHGYRKVVVSTNVAETSITISDIVAVVDSGRVKENVYDPESNYSRLLDVWTSQASATQRTGRAGRVRPGECYRLFTENAFNRMPVNALPEILRAPLEVLYLQVKAMGIAKVDQFLQTAIDPPKSAALETAENNLIAYGIINSVNLSLTPLGKLVSMIPADPRTAKMLIMGSLMGCLPSILTVAAILSNGKLPINTSRDEESKNELMFTEFGGSNGDLLASVRAFDSWRNNTASKSVVPFQECRNISSTRTQLISNLASMGLVPSKFLKAAESEWEPEYTKYNSDEPLLRTIIGASLQPNIAEIVLPQEKFVSTASGAIKKEGVDDSRLIKYYLANGERVFIHPRSMLFKTTNFGQSNGYLSYNKSVVTSKHFVAEVTPLSVYSMVLFASRIDVDPLGHGIIVNKWTGLKCWPRVGILLQFLQQLLNELMTAKFADPSSSLADHGVVQLVHDLIMSEGNATGYGVLA